METAITTDRNQRKRTVLALAWVALGLALWTGRADAVRGDCAQPVSNGDGPVATDCLYILRAAVGLESCSPECICAVRGTVPAVASDALSCLVMAVGGPDTRACPCTTTTSTSTSTSSTSTTTFDVVAPADWEEPLDAADIGWMMSSWGPGDGRLWLVGGKLTQGRIFLRDSGGWNEVDFGLSVQLLNWVHGTSGRDIFAGGNNGTILHWDGSSWSSQPTPSTDPVWGLWAVASDDVWAVGGNVNSSKPPFIWHWDGQSWSVSPIPALVRPGVHALFKVWGSGPEDVWAVGQNGVILHWNGSVWSETGAGISQDLIGIWGTGPDNIVAVGGRGTAELARYNGTSWSKAPASALPGLNGVWMRRPDVAHGVGVAGTVVRIDPATLAMTVDPAETSLDLHGVFGDAQGQLVALGANFLIPEHGVVLLRGLGDED